MLCHPRPLTTALMAATALLWLASVAQAQGVYRTVGPDGRVTFSDVPPRDATAPSVASQERSAAAARGPSLPFALQQVVTKYPATLYTTGNCGPCDSGRSLLVARGIPFAEKTVNTAEDIAAFDRLGTDRNLPLLVIGGQQVKGFSATEWNRYLDAAGYPATSALPSGHRPTQAQPLAPLKTAAEAPAPVDAPTDTPQQPASAPARSRPGGTDAANPTGIRF